MARGFHEVLGVDTLAHQAALHVGERDDDGVDEAFLDFGGELVLAERRLAIGPCHLVLGQHLDTTSRVHIKTSAGERSRAPTSLGSNR